LTRLDQVGRKSAIAILIFAIVLAIAGLWSVLSAPAAPPAVPEIGEGDLALFVKIDDAMRTGVSYYDAAHQQLTTNGYGTRSVFNWRTPALSWFLAALPSLVIAQALMVAMVGAAMVVFTKFFYAEGGRPLAYFGFAIMVLSLAFVFVPYAVLMHELPTGLLILLSVALYSQKRHRLGLAAGAAALVLREHAGIYVLVCIWLAWRARRRDELAGWAVLLCCYCAYFAWHYWQVQLQITSTDRAYPDSWIQFGGLRFVLATSQFNGVFALIPLPLHAFLMPAALLGLWAWPGETGLRARLTVVAAMLIFAMVGKPFNTYWGMIYTPLMSIGLALAPLAIIQLWRAIERRPALAS